MGICPVSICCGVRHVYSLWERRRMRLRMGHGCKSKRLHFHGISPEVNGDRVLASEEASFLPTLRAGVLTATKSHEATHSRPCCPFRNWLKIGSARTASTM